MQDGQSIHREPIRIDKWDEQVLLVSNDVESFVRPTARPVSGSGDLERGQPGSGEIRPVGARQPGRAQTVTVAAIREQIPGRRPSIALGRPDRSPWRLC